MAVLEEDEEAGVEEWAAVSGVAWDSLARYISTALILMLLLVFLTTTATTVCFPHLVFN